MGTCRLILYTRLCGSLDCFCTPRRYQDQSPTPVCTGIDGQIPKYTILQPEFSISIVRNAHSAEDCSAH